MIKTTFTSQTYLQLSISNQQTRTWFAFFLIFLVYFFSPFLLLLALHGLVYMLDCF